MVGYFSLQCFDTIGWATESVAWKKLGGALHDL